jgi:hypothetical protein
MYGKVPRNLDVKQWNRWLNPGDIGGETESTIVATWDQAVCTVQSMLKIKFWRNKLLVNAAYVNNIIKILVT